MLDPALGLLTIIDIALLFAIAARHKLQSLALFAEVFAAYRVLPGNAARRLAWVIPCAELTIAAALAWPASRGWAVFAAMSLLAAFACGLALNLARGRRDLDCGCTVMGNRRSIGAWMVWRNAVLVVALGAAALPWAARPLGAVDLLTIAGGVAASAMLYLAVDRLLGDVAPRAIALRGAPA
jgi:Methylamine utilisation protein MauE